VTNAEDESNPVTVGRLFHGDQLFGYLAVDKQGWRWKDGPWWNRRSWRTVENRWRLSMDPPDEGFLSDEDMDQLAHGIFRFRGEDLEFRTADGADRLEIIRDHFAKWA